MKKLKLKKIIALVLALALCLSLAGCGSKNTANNTNTSNDVPANIVPSNTNTNTQPNTNTDPVIDPKADPADECLEYIQKAYPYIEASLEQDPSIVHLYGWETAQIDEKTYLVAYALDHDNSDINDGYAILGYECRITNGSIKATPVTDASISVKYEDMGYTLYRPARPVAVNIGYYTDELYLIDQPDDVLKAMHFFFVNTGVQPYICAVKAGGEESETSAAMLKYQELFEIGSGEIDGRHILVLIQQAADNSMQIDVLAGSEASDILGDSCEDLLESEFSDRWQDYMDFSTLAVDAMNDALYQLYTCSRDEAGYGAAASIPASLVYVDTDEQTVAEYYPTVKFLTNGTFSYNMNLYEGMYMSGGNYYAYRDTNGNTVIVCTITEAPDEEGNVSEYDGLAFEMVSLKDSDIWLYRGEDTGMAWDSSIFKPGLEAATIDVTLQ